MTAAELRKLLPLLHKAFVAEFDARNDLYARWAKLPPAMQFLEFRALSKAEFDPGPLDHSGDATGLVTELLL